MGFSRFQPSGPSSNCQRNIVCLGNRRKSQAECRLRNPALQERCRLENESVNNSTASPRDPPCGTVRPGCTNRQNTYQSGAAIKSWVHFSGLAVADGQVYAVDHDSNV